MKRYVFERTIKAEITPEEQSENTENVLESLWDETQLKGPWRQKWTSRIESKGVG